jgi:hypothetical protein
LKYGVQYSLYDMSGVVSDLPFTGTSFDTETGNQTSILIINSRIMVSYIKFSILFVIRNFVRILC